MTTATLLVDAQARLGECPLWCEREQALYWTDIEGSTLSRWRAADASVRVWSLPDRVGSFALCERADTLLLGLAGGVALFHLSSGQVGPLTPVEADEPATRINDGRCDAQGRFVFGMFQRGASGVPLGSFYRVGPELHVQRLPLPRAVVANSIAFSPDGGRMYFADSVTRQIQCLDYHADGRLGRPENFARLADDDGVPDGSAVDALGRLWTAVWGGGCVACFDSEGRELRRLPVPAAHATCPAFGGPAHERLFVTSAREGLQPDALLRQPASGGVFVIDGATRGRPEHRFRAR
jgi:L-arabinonolactonase